METNVAQNSPCVNTLLDAALAHAKSGLPIFPCGLDKIPLIKNWPDAATEDEKQIREWWRRWPDASVGMPTGYRSGRLVIDIDPRHGGDKSLAVLEEEFGALPETLSVETGGGGRHLYFQLRGLDIRNSAGALARGIDIRGNGGYVVLPPSKHPSGNSYKFENAGKVLDLPEWLEKKLLALKATARAETNGDGERVPAGKRNAWLVRRAGQYRRAGDTPDVIYQKLVLDYETRCAHEPAVADKEFRAIAGWIERFAPEPGIPKAVIPTPPAVQEKEIRTIGSGREDTSNALRFAADHAGRVRFWHGRNRWMVWTGTHWDSDSLGKVMERAKETAKKIFIEAAHLPVTEAKQQSAWAERSLNRDKLSAMLSLAQSDEKIATPTDEWDTDDWALNFTNGTLDIRSGELRPHRSADLVTKLVRCPFTPDLIAPRWNRFIEQTFGSLASWIQKAVGYSITGITSEKVAFLLWGVTDTGKSTFLQTLRDIFSDYSTLIQIDSLMRSTNQASNNVDADLADLRGARLAITSETEEGQRLLAAKLKRITQGQGLIKATRKYENPISFPETHKLWLDCNHVPVIRGSDDAIWNRIVPISVTRQVTTGERDPELKAKFLHEAEGIASWAVAGAMRWHKEGLGRPELVLKTRDEWREQMDIIGQFLAERTIADEDSSVRAATLYKSFKEWCEEQGHDHPLTATAFGLRLAERMPKERDAKGVFYSGVRLVSGGLF